MSMKIRQVREYFPSGGYRSPYKGGGDTNALYQLDIPVQSIRAIAFQNLQMYARSYSGAARLKIRGNEILNVSDANSTYVIDFSFDSNLTPINIVSNSYSTFSNTTNQANFLSRISSLPANKYFAIICTGQNTLGASVKNKLYEIDALYATEVNAAVTFVAIGFNGKIIDSMWNGCDVGGASQVYVNGQNASIGKTTRRSDTLDTNGNPGSTYVVSLPQSGGKYYQVELTASDGIEIDYIIFHHNNVIPSYIIQNHKITVVDASGQECLLKQPSNGYIETVHGTRLYPFGQIQTDTIVTGGLESSISLSATNAALNRFRNQGAFTGFLDETYTATLNQTIFNNFNQFANQYPVESTTDNGSKVEGQDLLPLIKNSERIKYSLAGCNSGCSTTCFDNCTVTCKDSCGIYCGDSCSLACSYACGHSNCRGNCTANCAQVCGATCSGGCAALCAGGTCGTNCKDVCIGYCGGTCGYSCAGASCGGSCTGSCTGGYTIGCLACAGTCHGTCSNGCSGTCGTVCDSKTCGNNCYWACGASTCNNACGVSCDSTCFASCSGNACRSSCDLGCSNHCEIICHNACISSCTTSCVGTCLNSAQSGLALKPPVYI